jgi:uncharacterized protein YfaS (alpha-2-macroglobulin family)
MKRACLTVISLLAFSALVFAVEEEEDEKSNAKPDAGGIVIEPSHGKIAEGDEITITFPRSMVAIDLIDVADQPCPFVSNPKLDGTFLWKSETEGVFTVTGLVADAHHRLTLASGLKDANGKPFVAKDWSAEFKAPAFTITSDFKEGDELSARPQIYLTSTYTVRLADAIEHIYFQDRDSHQRLPVEIVLPGQDKTLSTSEGREFSVEPRQPLPVGHTYDLIVNGLVEAKSHHALPYLYVLPAGKTASLEIAWVGAFNHALDKPSIDIKFNDNIDPAEATPEKIHVDPPVKGMKFLPDTDDVTVTGDFDLKQRYKVTISTELKGARGYGLVSESRWGATFRPKESCLIFPSSQVFARARQELRFDFFQVNTPQVTWKLAAIPAEKLPAVTARVAEFKKDATDPVTGKAVEDPRTGFTKQFQTELLVDAFQLPVAATGTTEATSGDVETRREIRCTPKGGETFAGAYLLEASATLPDGRIVGNRTIVCVNDYLLTQKRTPTTVVLRVAKMSDGNPLSGVTVRAVTDENIELARATTDTDGMAHFPRETVYPKKGKDAHLFIADTPNGPALQFAQGESYSSGSDYARFADRLHAEIITDRNLYRPGQVVKMKGIVRDLSASGPAIPAATDVRWRVVEGDGERELGGGSTAFSSYDAGDAEWTIPEKAKLGHYVIDCRLGGKNYEGSTKISVEEYRVPLFSVVVEATNPEVGTTAHAKVSSAYFHGAPNVGARVHWKATWTASVDIGSVSNEESYRRRYNSYAEVGPRIDPDNEEIKNIEGDAQLDAHGFITLTCESPFKNNPAIGHASVLWRADVTSVDGQTLTGGDLENLFSAPARLGVNATEQTTEPAGVKVKIDAVDPENKNVNDVSVHADLFHVTTKSVKEQVGPFIYRYRNTDEFARVASQDSKTPAELNFPTTETGRYVVAVSAPQMKTPLVSDETTVTGEKPAELPVVNETTFKIEHQSEPFLPGQKAVLTTQAPFGGVAWVSVEAEEILDTFLIPIKGNAGRVELPIKKEYAPNATVSIYLVRPGGDKELPRERFAYSEIEVRRPERELKIELHLASGTVKPGETVRGDVRVTSENKSVADVDLVVFAVDDAVLTLGDWHLPVLGDAFYPRNIFSVRTYEALHGYIENLAKLQLTQKGFVIGGGGEETISNTKNVRKEFRTLAF